MYSCRAFDALILNHKLMFVPIKCAISKIKFIRSTNMSMALMIWVGSIIIMPGGIDSVFAINNDMLSVAPVQDIILKYR